MTRKARRLARVVAVASVIAWIGAAAASPAGAAGAVHASSVYPAASAPRVPCCGGGGSSYDGAKAAAYADKYVGTTLDGTSGWNTTYKYIWQNMTGDDCTEYVSEALVAGGLPWVDDNYQDGSEAGASFFNYQSTAEWWLMSPTQAYVYYGNYAQAWSDSASVAPMLRQFVIGDGGGYQVGTFSTRNTAPADTPNPMTAGDLLFFDWGTGQGISHVAIEVGNGTASNGQVGSLVDEHISNRKHVFWSLKDYNPDWETTTVYFVHV